MGPVTTLADAHTALITGSAQCLGVSPWAATRQRDSSAEIQWATPSTIQSKGGGIALRVDAFGDQRHRRRCAVHDAEVFSARPRLLPGPPSPHHRDPVQAQRFHREAT